MRSLPIDASKISFIGTGKFAEKPAYAVMSDGSRRRVPGKQATTDDGGIPLWVVDVLVDDDDSDRAETVSVTVATHEVPQPPKFQPVHFEGLTASAYIKDGSRFPTFSFKATGMKATGMTNKPQQTPAKAA